MFFWFNFIFIVMSIVHRKNHKRKKVNKKDLKIEKGKKEKTLDIWYFTTLLLEDLI